MRIETCYFCSAPCYPSKGITFVRNDAKQMRFCSSKCHKNFKMKRNPRKLPWTKSFRRSHGKEMTIDSTLTFAMRRNIPTRYNRHHITSTLAAMKRISEIRAKRERVFYRKRMAGNKERQRELDRKTVLEGAHLLPRERGSERVARERLERELVGEVDVADVDVDELEDELVQEQQKVEKKRTLVRSRVVGGGEIGMEVDDD